MKAYEVLVNQVIEKLEQGIVPWKKPWVGGMPSNYISDIPYRGFNRLVLSLNDYDDQRYLTIKQVNKLGGKIIKGTKGTKIFYYLNKEEESDDNNSIVSYPIIRYYTVFNIEQIEGIEFKQVESDVSDNTNLYRAQQIITEYVDKPIIQNGLNASYDTLNDIITIPSLYKFKSNGEYFSTLFHELVHSTGSPKRLSRFGIDKTEHYGSVIYSREELVAELGSMFLCIEAGVSNDVLENSKNYIAGWLRYIKWNKRNLITASNQADKAVKYVLGTNISTEN